MAKVDTKRDGELGLRIEEHRRALTVHCYRFLGSMHDAGEANQETFLRAWRTRDGYRGEASLKTWPYRIRHTCLSRRAGATLATDAPAACGWCDRTSVRGRVMGIEVREDDMAMTSSEMGPACG